MLASKVAIYAHHELSHWRKRIRNVFIFLKARKLKTYFLSPLSFRSERKKILTKVENVQRKNHVKEIVNHFNTPDGRYGTSNTRHIGTFNSHKRCQPLLQLNYEICYPGNHIYFYENRWKWWKVKLKSDNQARYDDNVYVCNVFGSVNGWVMPVTQHKINGKVKICFGKTI